MSKFFFLATAFCSVLVFGFFYFSGEIGLVFYTTVMIGFFFFYSIYILVNLVKISVRKSKFNYTLLLIPLFTCIFHSSWIGYVFQKWSNIDASVKNGVYQKQYCGLSDGFKLTRSHQGISRDYMVESKDHCIRLRSPSYSFSNVEYSYCGCNSLESDTLNVVD